VAVEDVAQFIVDDLVSPEQTQSQFSRNPEARVAAEDIPAKSEILSDPPNNAHIALLGSGKPTSIGEIVHLVETALGRRLYVSYSDATDNRDDITIAPVALPPRWHPSNLAPSIRWYCRNALCGITVFGKQGST
jgi:hypothetical protein